MQCQQNIYILIELFNKEKVIMNHKIQTYTELNPVELDLLVEKVVNKINDTKSYKRIEITKIIENLDISERLKI